VIPLLESKHQKRSGKVKDSKPRINIESNMMNKQDIRKQVIPWVMNDLLDDVAYE